ncbi:hypothetical protein E3P96_02160 [Wallemia ichthyophaga]|nr:hypothetical protein E3P96_02160 [Wallemia ichthyophaga]
MISNFSADAPTARWHRNSLRRDITRLNVDTTKPVVVIASNDYDIYASNGNADLLFTLKDFLKATNCREY